jgi:hypothetical protein
MHTTVIGSLSSTALCMKLCTKFLLYKSMPNHMQQASWGYGEEPLKALNVYVLVAMGTKTTVSGM